MRQLGSVGRKRRQGGVNANVHGIGLGYMQGVAVEVRQQRGCRHSVPLRSAIELGHFVLALTVSEQVHLQFAIQFGYETVDEAPDFRLPWLWDGTELALALAD